MLEKMNERFMSKVNQTATCWLWKNYLDKNGYGRFYINGKYLGAHRYSYMFHKGSIQSSLVIRHTCDQPSCVNPDHLLIGTQSDNIKDRDERNRTAHNKGEKAGGVKLTNDIIKEIRILYGFGFTQRELSKMYNVSQPQISNILTNKRWSHI